MLCLQSKLISTVPSLPLSQDTLSFFFKDTDEVQFFPPAGECWSAPIRHDPLVQDFRASAGCVQGQGEARDGNKHTTDPFHIHVGNV